MDTIADAVQSGALESFPSSWGSEGTHILKQGSCQMGGPLESTRWPAMIGRRIAASHCYMVNSTHNVICAALSSGE